MTNSATLGLYVDKLQRMNADDLAFYPRSTLDAAIESGHVLFCHENGQPAGYLWFGAINAGRDIVIYQACIDYEARRRHLGEGMVRELIAIARVACASGIRLKCASSADSNAFWSAIGFYCTRVTAGGVKRGRDINHYRTDTMMPLFVVESVVPSVKPIDMRAYNQMKRDGVEMPSRFSRRHYGGLTNELIAMVENERNA